MALHYKAARAREQANEVAIAACDGIWIGWLLGALAGLIAVAMAALAAHGLAGLDPAGARAWWRAASRCRAGTRWPCWRPGSGRGAAARLAHLAGAAFTLGLLLFCGAVYALALGRIAGDAGAGRRHPADAGLALLAPALRRRRGG